MNIAIFSVVNAVLLKPVPFPEPDTLVQLTNANNGAPTGPASSPAKYMHWRSQTDVLEHVAAGRSIELNLEQGDVLESIRAAQTTAEYFGAYRPPLIMGRWFTAEEDLPNAGYTVVLSYKASVLYGVQARDVLVFVGVPTVLAATAFAAVWIAARRASLIDPLDALRHE